MSLSHEEITMADDVNPQLRAELNSALDVLMPQIRGMHDLLAVSITTELHAEISDAVAKRERRRDLIQAVLNDLDATQAARAALEDDGYPSLPNVTIVNSQFTELQGEAADLQAAVGVFGQEASRLSVGLGAAVDKPKE
jgi:hypothetical protein